MSSGWRRIHSHAVGATMSQGSTPMTTHAPRQPMPTISASTSGVITTSPTFMPDADMPVAAPAQTDEPLGERGVGDDVAKPGLAYRAHHAEEQEELPERIDLRHQHRRKTHHYRAAGHQVAGAVAVQHRPDDGVYQQVDDLPRDDGEGRDGACPVQFLAHGLEELAEHGQPDARAKPVGEEDARDDAPAIVRAAQTRPGPRPSRPPLAPLNRTCVLPVV